MIVKTINNSDRIKSLESNISNKEFYGKALEFIKNNAEFLNKLRDL